MPISDRSRDYFRKALGDPISRDEIIAAIDAAAPAANAVLLTGDQTIAGTKTFTATITGSISGNAGTVTNGVYTTGNQTIAGTKTFSAAPTAPFGSGANNERFGASSGNNSATGQNNNTVGVGAGAALTTGESNCFFGVLAGDTATEGAGNVCLGALADVAAADADSAIAIGQLATAADSSIAIGTSAVSAANEFSLAPSINSINNHVLSSTATNRKRFSLTAANVDNTDATRKYRLVVSAWDTAEREAFRCEGSGTAALLSFFGVSAVARPSALTQTYSTADRTHANPTAATLTDNSGGTANTTVQALTNPGDSPASADALRDDLVANLIPELRNNFADLAAQHNALLADLLDLKQFVNSLVDDLQSLGLEQ